MKKKIFLWLRIVIIVYCLIGIVLYYFQDKIFFRPKALADNYQFTFGIPHKELNLAFSHQSNINIVQFLTKNSTPKGVVLYFHGNRENIERYASRAPQFTKNNYEVWMIDYPGYGKSTGEFTEEVLYNWAEIFYKLARARFPKDSIILYGRSLGSGIAAQLASKRNCRALVLETPYYSFPSLAGSWFPIYPVKNMIRFKIPTWEYLKDVIAPVIILHGSDDGVIPYRNAKKLMPQLKPGDQFITIEDGSHNDLAQFEQYRSTLDSLLQR